MTLLLAGCDAPSALDPGGPRAAKIAGLWWLMLAIAGIAFIVVVSLIAIASIRSARLRRADHDTSVIPEDRDTRLIVYGGIVIPAVVLVGLFVVTLFDLSALGAPDDPAALTIEVTGHQWWWEVRYPDDGVVTANEIHIPAGEPVAIKLLSADVIHSFWVPQLQGKLDMIPGQINTTWIEADEPGVFRGQCAEFCGQQHANMAFEVIAQTPDEYAAWIAHQREPSPEPSSAMLEQGEQVFLGSACVYCHTIDGTAAKGNIGPNLTHIASRNTLAAGTVPNNIGNLAGWILDPQNIKPGTQMPPTLMTGDDLQALLAYLESLK